MFFVLFDGNDFGSKLYKCLSSFKLWGNQGNISNNLLTYETYSINISSQILVWRYERHQKLQHRQLPQYKQEGYSSNFKIGQDL